jgi:hypothetical protein
MTDHSLHGFNYNVEEWDADGLHYETLAICRQLAFARAVFKEAVAEKTTGRFMIRSRTRVVKRHPEGDWKRPVDSGAWSLRRLDHRGWEAMGGCRAARPPSPHKSVAFDKPITVNLTKP